MKPCQNAVQIKGLVKSFTARDNDNPEKLMVFNGFTMNISQRELLAIFGPNGCGKTTLLAILAGLIAPESGNISYAHTPPEGPHIGFVFQDYRSSLFPWLSVLGNLTLPLRFGSNPLGKSDSEAQVLEFLAKMELKNLLNKLNRYPYELSGRQQQLVAIVRSLVTKPDLLLMDEPFGALDFQARQILRQQILSLWQRTGVTVVFVTHDLQEAILMASRIWLLGGLPAQTLDAYDIELPPNRNLTTTKLKSFHQYQERALSSYYEDWTR